MKQKDIFESLVYFLIITYLISNPVYITFILMIIIIQSLNNSKAKLNEMFLIEIKLNFLLPTENKSKLIAVLVYSYLGSKNLLRSLSTFNTLFSWQYEITVPVLPEITAIIKKKSAKLSGKRSRCRHLTIFLNRQ